MFEPENILKMFSRDMILSKFGECKYYYKTISKPSHIFFWVRVKKDTQLLIGSGDINLSNIDRIDTVLGVYHSQGVFRFPMKIVYIINNGKKHESIQPVG